MTEPSAEQWQIIGAPLAPMSVIACAGSGKTFTAVRRLAEMRRQLGDQRGRVALLSFSNIAVETFRREYQSLVSNAPAGVAYGRVEIDTLDSFLTGNVLRPHAHRTMGCDRVPFLIAGTEQFLQNRDFKFWAEPPGGRAFPVKPADFDKIVVSLGTGRPTFHLRSHNALVPVSNGAEVVRRLGALGAYTHNLGRYWCLLTLVRQPGILRVLARRYPHILVDEAQDVGSEHQQILERLMRAGSQLSLIGDPNQCIYEFAGATGSFLTQYWQQDGVSQVGLTINYRSVPAVVNVANRLSGRGDSAHRSAPEAQHGVFFVQYRQESLNDVVELFGKQVTASGLTTNQSAILCRARSVIDKLAGGNRATGQGIVKRLATAAVLRDRDRNFKGAFEMVVEAVVGLLAKPSHDIAMRIRRPDRLSNDRQLKRIVWAFTRNSAVGLPDASLPANTAWHMKLRRAVEAMLECLAKDHGLPRCENLGSRLANRELPTDSLIPEQQPERDGELPRIRVDTVHGAKGESLDAVLYLADTKDVRSLLDGPCSEAGRIGYVAVTRARNLFWLGVPDTAIKGLRPRLEALGFREFEIGAK